LIQRKEPKKNQGKPDRSARFAELRAILNKGKFQKQEEVFLEINRRFSNLSKSELNDMLKKDLNDFTKANNKKNIYFFVEESVNMKLDLVGKNQFYKLYKFNNIF
jgi:arginine repressor